jgi:uncharacterized protein with HEPN domain
VTAPADKKPRHDIGACLEDMRHAADCIERYTSGVSREEFLQNNEKQDAVVRRIEIIGEAADRLMKADPDYKEHFPDLPLRDIKDMRNLVIHGYDAVDPKIIWDTTQLDVPNLYRKITAIITERTVELP